MKNASRVMYIISRIFNFIEIGVFAILLIVLGIVPLAASGAIEDEEARLVAVTAGATMLVTFLILLAVAIVVCILLNKAYKSLETGEKKTHILMLVLGAISENPFLFLGGLFGLIAN